MRRTLGYGTLVSLTLLLAACGGGGGNEGDSQVDTPAGDHVSLSLLDCSMLAEGTAPSPATCTPTADLWLGKPAIAYAVATDENGQPLKEDIGLLFDNTAKERITVEPSSQSLPTDENGAAAFTLTARSLMNTASFMAGLIDRPIWSEPVTFAVKPPPLTLTLESSLAAGQQLAIGSQLRVTAKVVDGAGSPFTVPLAVQFSSDCSEAITESPITTSLGQASVTYQPDNCPLSQDTLAAEIVDVGALTTLTIPLAPPVLENLAFESATPEVIYLPASAGPSNSTVRFKITDADGNALSGQPVNFFLDESLVGAQLQPATDTSDSQGLVETQLFAGQLPGSVAVEASMAAPGDGSIRLTSVSAGIAVRTGVPDQANFTFSVLKHALEAGSADDKVVELGAIVTDEQGNPVPDGTVIDVYTEGSDIGTPEQCITSAGQCLLSWTHEAHSLPANGRTTLLATTAGQESFIDTNASGIWDDNDSHDPLSEAWSDFNENGEYNPDSDIFLDINSNGEFDPMTGDHNNSIPASEVEELYNGLRCLPEDEAQGLCSRNLVDLFASEVIILATSEAAITVLDASAEEVRLQIQDLNGNQMPAGTMVTFDVDPGEIIAPTSYTIKDGTRYEDLFQVITLQPEDSTGGSLRVTVTSPGGVETVAEVPIPAP